MSHASESTVVLIDDMMLRRAALARIVADWSGCEIATLAPDEVGAVDLPQTCELLVLNVGSLSVAHPKAMGWMEALKEALPGRPLLILSDLESNTEVVAAFSFGASGFMPSSIDPIIARQAFAFLRGGGTFFPPSALLEPPTERAPIRSADDEPTALSCLTMRQRAVLDGLREGKSNKLIARELDMCESTVKVHVRQIMRKLGAANRTQAALRAAQAPLAGRAAAE